MFKINDILTVDCDVVEVWTSGNEKNLIFRRDPNSNEIICKPIFLLLRLEPTKHAPTGFKYYFLFNGEICYRYDVTFFTLLSRIEE